MEIFSFWAAHPHKITVVFRCKTMFEDTIAGRVTSALIDRTSSKKNTARKIVKGVRLIFSSF
jgi:hypothetical protein